MMRLAIVFGIVAMVTIPVHAFEQGVIGIDDMFGGEYWILSNSVTQTDSGMLPEDVIGGERYTTFTVTSGAPTLAHISDPTCGIEYASGTDGGLATWSLEYGRANNLNVDLVTAERSVFTLDIRTKNIDNAVPLTVTVTSHEGELDESTWSVTTDIIGVATNTAGSNLYLVVQLPYSDFGTNVDFSDVDYLKFAFDCSDPSLSGLDLTIDGIVNCPEPRTLSLLAVGGLGLIGLIRRKQRTRE